MRGLIGFLLVVLAQTSSVYAAPPCTPSTAAFVEDTFTAPRCPAVRIHKLETSVAFQLNSDGITKETRNALLKGAVEAFLRQQGNDRVIAGGLASQLLEELDKAEFRQESHRFARRETSEVTRGGVRMKAVGEVDRGIAVVTLYLYQW